MQPQQHFIASAPGHKLRLQRFAGDENGPPLLMVHGSIENGRIFHPRRGSGLAPWLAQQGYDVFVANLRGKGGSTPPIDGQAAHGQHETIVEDLPALSQAISQLRPDRKQGWICHSWGGVMACSCLARFEEVRRRVAALVLFGTKRAITVFNLQKLLKYDLLWRGLGRLMIARYGYLPARRFRFGGDSEPALFHQETSYWAAPRNPWSDPRDQFDYQAAARRATLPSSLWLAAAGDRFLGHPQDVQRFMHEAHGKQAHGNSYHLLGRGSGNLHDYDHINMLTHPDAFKDHYPMVHSWLATTLAEVE